jgi:hypothetical protein
LAGKPSGNETNHQYDQETLARHIHVRIFRISSMTGQIPAQPQEGQSLWQGRRDQQSPESDPQVAQAFPAFGHLDSGQRLTVAPSQMG